VDNFRLLREWRRLPHLDAPVEGSRGRFDATGIS
jgi:hypothetical protein